ncbi:MAG: DNA repair protein RadA [Melioribacteraceae bacterium]|nr:DNA repair protein RadA [Melioribacteraceae bacterium]
MAKSRTKYVCSGCGYDSAKWLGKCPNCDEWNTFTEEVEETGKNARRKINTSIKADVVKLSGVPVTEHKRIATNINEFDRVLGNGIMPGSVILIGGDPGIGKSTLVMQASSSIKEKVLYITGEESINQINLRAKRLKVNTDNFYVLAETRLDIISAAIEQTEPDVVIIDSIQTMYRPELDNAPGTVTQIRETTTELMQNAKKNHFAVIIVGHVTKEGNIAGPKILEHIVDTVLQFEGERNYSYRILRAQKNRFGSTNEIGIFEMHDTGLSEVTNPSEIFLSERDENATGSIVTSSMEGTRPVLLEVQALVTPSNFGNPQRVATGFDYRRLSILLAVLEKRVKLRLSANNVFLNMAGGLRISEPAVDLAVCCSIASSLLDKSLKTGHVVIGEVGLGGEVRSVSHIEKRIQEAEKLGFETIIIPKNNSKINIKNHGIKIIQVRNVSDVINKLLG